ncbi:Atxe2 family lasso peptide isopeptidase [Sphingomonas canadensis]|uniref:Atxe2 family lasso peptide isopeptidase n=1 Tax=Sphingomonas canadensis TaxID=1219257 RepID=A0ABW3HAH9_9SPHN|nr:Atxe2 family lasso peptide isopeptidase [Sphingomonas canadensis]
MPPRHEAATGTRPIKPRDLIELRDFGRSDASLTGKPIYTLSPDGMSAAIALRRADVQSDSYCLGVAIIRLDGSRRARLIDVGGEFMQSYADGRGIPATPTGSAYGTAPIWSPDGKAVFYLRRDHGVTQVWRAAVDETQGRPLTHFSTDALSIEWSSVGRTLLVATRPALAAGAAAIENEGRRGYHYDARWSPHWEAKPRPPLPLPQQISAIDPRTGEERILLEAEARKLKSVSMPSRPTDAELFTISAAGNRAWTTRVGLNPFNAPRRFHVEFDGRELNCPDAICGAGVSAAWWRNDHTLEFLRGGRADDGGRLALYRWDIRRGGSPQLQFQTDAALMDCTPWHASMLCAVETARMPRRLVKVDPSTGRFTTLFDANPQFASLRLGAVERLRFRNAIGQQTYGDLVLPPNHRAGQRHPLVVVQYISRGFLRGGTGDEYPIFLLAQQGIAVLSFQRTGYLPETYATADPSAAQRVNIEGFKERRAIFSALLAGVDAAIGKGVVDPDQLGISGMSDGASTTQFALINSNRFRAAAISSCCDEPSWLFVTGPAYRDQALSWGYPKQASDGEAFWKAMSLTANAPTMRTPLLIQVPDSEFRGALEPFSALQQYRAPVDMYVFPNEMHVKAHPAHRLAIYQRAVAWFRFWLLASTSDEPELANEIIRWKALRNPPQ